MSAASAYLYIAAAAALLAVIGAVHKGWPHVRRFFARLNGTFDAIVGREAYVDPASGKEVEALPPLTSRVASLEEVTVALAQRMTAEAETRRRVDHLEGRVDGVEKRLQTVEDARIERIVAQAESAQMWRAVAEAKEPGSDPMTPPTPPSAPPLPDGK